MKLAKKDLKNIEIKVTKKGFTVWVSETNIINGEAKVFRHWLLDGSCLKEDGEIRIGTTEDWNINAVYNDEAKSLSIMRKRNKK